MSTARIFRRLNALLRERISSFLELDTASADENREKQFLAAIDALKSELGLTLVERRRIATQLAAIEDGKAELLGAQAEAAIELGEETLARAALMKKAELEKQRAALQLRLDELTSAARELEIEAQRLQDPSGDGTLAARLSELETLLKDSQITDYIASTGDR